MQTFTELEQVLDNIDCIADTLLAIDTANQCEALALPQFALTIPAERIKSYAEKARTLYTSLMHEANNQHRG